MSDAKKPFTRPKVPEGHAFHVTTRQKEITPGKFFGGYETIWEPHQHEVPYQTPKKPWAYIRVETQVKKAHYS